ncbi:ABC transporter ATP-binding protein [Spirochaeta cellobiosiphila]|uniref:ABC transporter ATP-binding protein n=1 Tax=Spirochaeta cellobiosiphila TaxID=504483 RepID=UPI00042098E2|nr:ABC transporter ATP-binding protein [Spirochaeta cellobiosiphila]
MIPLFDITQLSWSYGKKTILQDFNLTIESGQFLGIIGPNGSGKTTLIKLMMGLLPSKHSIKLAGKPLSRYSHKERAKMIAYVPQRPETSYPYTVSELIMMGRYAHQSLWKQETEQDKQIVIQIMEELGIASLSHQTIDTLSGGEMQLVLLGKALAQESSCLILDEPTNHLDAKHQGALLQQLKRIQQKDITIISIFHDINAAVGYSDNILLLENGHPVFYDRGNKLASSKQLEKVFGMTFVSFTRDNETYLLPERKHQ